MSQESFIGILLRDVVDDEAIGYSNVEGYLPTKRQIWEARLKADIIFTRVFKNDMRVWWSFATQSYEFEL